MQHVHHTTAQCKIIWLQVYKAVKLVIPDVWMEDSQLWCCSKLLVFQTIDMALVGHVFMQVLLVVMFTHVRWEHCPTRGASSAVGDPAGQAFCVEHVGAWPARTKDEKRVDGFLCFSVKS